MIKRNKISSPLLIFFLISFLGMVQGFCSVLPKPGQALEALARSKAFRPEDDLFYKSLLKQKNETQERINDLTKKAQELSAKWRALANPSPDQKAKAEQMSALISEEKGKLSKKLEEIEKVLLEQKTQIERGQYYDYPKKYREGFVESIKKAPPEIYKTVKESVMHPSGSEFSGALEWAHRHNILGEGTFILILEPGIAEPFNKIERYAKHVHTVSSVLKEMAPKARTTVRSPLEFEKSIKASRDALSQVGIKKRILNYSGSLERESHLAGTSHFVSQIIPLLSNEFNNLLVVSMGNNHEENTPMAEAIRRALSFSHISEFAYEGSVSMLDYPLIMAISLTSSYEIAAHSNRPGRNSIIQNRSLCTLGQDVIVRASPVSPIETVSGTSFAAPIISGSASLVLSAHPTLSMVEIADILLESADKNFLVRNDKGQIICVYDPRNPEEKEKVERIYPEDQRQYFDPSQYGRGILNLRRALIYADIYEQVKKEGKLRGDGFFYEIRRRFQEEIKRLDTLHATNIQKAFRDWKVRKSLKKGEEV